MALSRTARVLVAILLLAAAAFFWFNFFNQNRLAETPSQDVVATTPVPPVPANDTEVVEADGDPDETDPDATSPTATTAAVADAPPSVDGPTTVGTPGEPGTDASTPIGETAQGAAPTAVDEAGNDAAPVVAEVAPTIVVDDAPPVVVVDAPVAVSRDVVIVDLPFLVTAPPAPTEAEAPGDDTTAVLAVTVPTRVTINPFSPVVVRVPEVAEREVPADAAAAGVVPVPTGPTTVAVPPPPPPRREAPTPAALTPATVATASLIRDLPSGAVLGSTPDLLRAPRVETVAERFDLPSITALAVPGPEPIAVATVSAPRPSAPLADLQPLPNVAPALAAALAADPGSTATVPAVTTTAPLSAGTSRLARYLRDNDVVFTGSVLGPVSVGVFRSRLEAGPIVVSLGQTLPDTEIVLTNLRGMQAELTLGDSSQILSLDLRR